VESFEKVKRQARTARFSECRSFRLQGKRVMKNNSKLLIASSRCALAALLATGAATLVSRAAPAKMAAHRQVGPARARSITGRWTIDPMHSSALFSIRHFGISEVAGRFDDISGTIIANAAHPEASSVAVVIKTASIDTNVKMRDDDLRSSNYFDAVRYPTIQFKSTRISRVRNGYVAIGNLTMHGVTRPVRLPFTINGPISMHGGSRFGFTTAVTLNRNDFGIGTKTMGAGALGSEVPVTISIEAVPAESHKKH
jgi:polyisoprenoid-binding protein YceI